MPRLRSAALGLALLAALAASCAPPAASTRSAKIFSSNVVLTLYGHASESAFEACFARLREIDAEMNMWDPASELSRLNARAGQGALQVSADLARVAGQGLELARGSGGIFDPSVGPLVKLWGIGSDNPRVPSEAEVAGARARVGWRGLRVDEAGGAIELAPGMELDFGALAKGYGAMEGGRLLASLGVRSGLLDVGGCVLALGSDPRSRAWKIGIQRPGSPRGSPLGYFSLRDSAVDTSGTYERYFESGGHRYAHIMDTRTGRPVEGSLISATIAVPRGQNSDGPPLALLVLGPEAGLALADRLGLSAVLVAEGRRLYLSKAAKANFTLIDRSYSIED